jgi:hypothetical protein
MVPICPPELLPVVVSKSMVRCLLAARVNKKNTLHGLSFDAINQIAAGVGDEPNARIALGINK